MIIKWFTFITTVTGLNCPGTSFTFLSAPLLSGYMKHLVDQIDPLAQWVQSWHRHQYSELMAYWNGLRVGLNQRFTSPSPHILHTH